MATDNEPSSFSFTCISCRVAFLKVEIQKQHYKTDWHRYNLKRKVVNLPPVTAEEFQQRVIEQREKEANETKDTSTYCKACHKKFSSDKAFQNHLNSKKHKEAVDVFAASNNIEGSVTIGDISCPVKKEKVINEEISQNSEMEVDEFMEDSDIEEIDSDEWEDEDDDILMVGQENPILNNDCLFCTHHSASLLKNLKHMFITHSFFIPDLEYVNDVRNLLFYLGEKISSHFVCLWCQSVFSSLEAVQMHMRDKGHCKMLHEQETLLEYELFYDYSRSYPDYNVDNDKDEEVYIPQLDGEDFELTLPSGSTIGHRDLMRYYKQHYAVNNFDVDLKKKTKLNKVISTYRALGWKESDKQIVTRKVKDIKYMKRAQMKYYTKLGVKANKLQKHFRPQVNF